MNSLTKKILAFSSVALLTFGVIAISCNSGNKSSNVAFAETNPAVNIDPKSLAVAQSLQETFREISAQVLPAVVEVDVVETTKVQTFNPFKDLPFFFGFPNEEDDDDEKNYTERQSQALGSGVIVRANDKKVYVLTNNHVAGSATKITIKLNDEREFEGTLVGSDERMDIALVSFECDDPSSITVAKLGDSDQLEQGDIVLALGSPLGYFASVTQGIVSATRRSGSQIGNISDFIQTDASINQGNSGGPLVNIYGEVIGINTWIASQSGGSQGLGFSIPINNIKPAIDQFITNGKMSYGWLGVSLMQLTEESKKDLGIEENQNGAFIAQIFLNGPASKGGMQVGDFVIALNGHDVKSVEQLVREVGSIPSGSTANFTVLRGSNKLELSVKIDERTQDLTNDNSKLWPGFIATSLTDSIRKQLKVNDRVKGVVVTNLQEKSPAAALRLQNGNIITAVNDKPVSNLQEFYESLNTLDNTEIWFDFYVDGHTIQTGKYKIEKN